MCNISKHQVVTGHLDDRKSGKLGYLVIRKNPFRIISGYLPEFFSFQFHSNIMYIQLSVMKLMFVLA